MSRHIDIPITEIKEEDNKLDSNNHNKFIFSKTFFDLKLFEHKSIKELFNYINNEDIEITKVKFLIRKANIKLRTNGKQLFIRKPSDGEVENIICVTSR